MRVSVLFSAGLTAGCIGLGVALWVLKDRESAAEAQLWVKGTDLADMSVVVDAEKVRVAQANAELAKLRLARVQAEENSKANPSRLSYREQMALKVAAPEAQARIAGQLGPMVRIYGSIYGLGGQDSSLSPDKFQEVFVTAASRQAEQGVENAFRDNLLNSLIRHGATEAEAATVALCGEYQLRLLALGAALTADQLRDVVARVKGAAGTMVSPEEEHGKVIGPFQHGDIQNLETLLTPAQLRELARLDRVLADRKALADKWNEIAR